VKVEWVLAALFVLPGQPASAAEPFDGRWAAEPQACTDEGALVPPLTVTRLLLTWPGAACMVRTGYRVGNAWHISARCFGEGAISEVPIKLQMRGELLILDWPKARPEELRRCP
jgi:hypothetical protein